MTTDPTTLASQTVSGFLEQLSAKVPTPGGGAAAAITGATAAATAAMVVSYSLDKKSLAEYQDINENAMAQLTRDRNSFLSLADQDAIGYGQLNALWKLDKDDPIRVAQWDDAVAGAMAPPRAMLALSIEFLRLCQRLIKATNPQLKSDLGVAAVLGQAAARSAAWNIRINIPLLPESEQQDARDATRLLVEQADALCKTIEEGCA